MADTQEGAGGCAPAPPAVAYDAGGCAPAPPAVAHEGGGCAPAPPADGSGDGEAPPALRQFTIKVPSNGATLYFWRRATYWEDVKRYISDSIYVPTTRFHLIMAYNGQKLNNMDRIDAYTVRPWQALVVVIKEW